MRNRDKETGLSHRISMPSEGKGRSTFFISDEKGYVFRYFLGSIRQEKLSEELIYVLNETSFQLQTANTFENEGELYYYAKVKLDILMNFIFQQISKGRIQFLPADILIEGIAKLIDSLASSNSIPPDEMHVLIEKWYRLSQAVDKYQSIA